MAQPAVREKFTYTVYTPDEPRGRVIRDAELEAGGKVWTRGAYAHPVYPSVLDVGVGNTGMSVWAVTQALRRVGGDAQALVREYDGYLTLEDIEAARWFYEENKKIFDEELEREGIA
jgi:uncharacterized protein (DUF433 family)